jgi:hypothetical protein
MKIIVTGDLYIEEVDAEPFEITGSDEQFAVHEAIGSDPALRGLFTASHVATGLAIGRGDTPAFAIADARQTWAAKTSQQRAEAVINGMGVRSTLHLEKRKAAQ